MPRQPARPAPCAGGRPGIVDAIMSWSDRGRKVLRLAGPVLGLAVFCGMLWVLHRELAAVQMKEVWQQMRELPARQIVRAIVLTISAYLVLTAYDMLALRCLDKKLPTLNVMLTAFLSFVFTNNINLSVVGAGAVRLRMYTTWGLSAVDVAKLVGFTSLTYWQGICLLSGLVFVTGAQTLPVDLVLWLHHHLPRFLDRWVHDLFPLGVLMLVITSVYPLACALRHRPIHWHGWEITLPKLRLAMAQTLVGGLDWALAAATLFVLLPLDKVPVETFMSAYLLAQVLGLLSHAPGGVGVFEGIMIVMLKEYLPAAELLSALMAFRLVYYLLPFAVGVVLMAGYEVRRNWHLAKEAETIYDRWVANLVPHALAFTTFIAGALLLGSGSVPALPQRLEWLDNLLPLPYIEVSHLLGSLVGVALLFLARGLQLRLDVAYWLTAAMLQAGIGLSLLRGLDWEEALGLLVMLLLLLPARKQFYRRSSLFAERFTWGWIMAILVVLAGSIWLGVLYHHNRLRLGDQMWWQIHLRGDGETGRFLRASLGAITIAVAIGLARLLRPARVTPQAPSRAVLDQAATIVHQHPRAYGHLALVGDKQFLFSDDGSAFIMYGVQRSCWVAMGDPIGPPDQHRELAWRFRELCHRHAVKPVFYQVDPEHLPVYLDLGLTFLKLGEEAAVPLARFTLDGHARKELRQAVRRAVREGCVFDVIPTPEVPSLLPELRAVSAAWLAQKHRPEKGFSLGYFNEDYLCRGPVATVRQDGRLVAFANLWLADGHTEFSFDLTRQHPDAPPNIMTFLVVNVLLWGQARGYGSFNWGMAPLAGIEDRALAPVWNRVGAWLYRHGEHFYSFAGLRAYKQKFAPVWAPRYLASPGGLALPMILGELVSLISRHDPTRPVPPPDPHDGPAGHDAQEPPEPPVSDLDETHNFSAEPPPARPDAP